MELWGEGLHTQLTTLCPHFDPYREPLAQSPFKPQFSLHWWIEVTLRDSDDN